MVSSFEIGTKIKKWIGNVYYKDKIVGVVTSGAYGVRLNKSLAFAYIESSIGKNVKELQIQIQGSLRKATILDYAAYDNKNTKLMS